MPFLTIDGVHAKSTPKKWSMFTLLNMSESDKMDPMYIIPKDPPEPHNDVHDFFLRPSWILLFLSLAQHTDKIDPMYIIPKDPPEPHDDAYLIFLCFQFWL